jgi:hypothetical protein
VGSVWGRVPVFWRALGLGVVQLVLQVGRVDVWWRSVLRSGCLDRRRPGRVRGNSGEIRHPGVEAIEATLRIARTTDAHAVVGTREGEDSSAPGRTPESGSPERGPGPRRCQPRGFRCARSVSVGPKTRTRAWSASSGGSARNSSATTKASLTGVARLSARSGAPESRTLRIASRTTGWLCPRAKSRRPKRSPGSGGRQRPPWSGHASAPTRWEGACVGPCRRLTHRRRRQVPLASLTRRPPPEPPRSPPAPPAPPRTHRQVRSPRHPRTPISRTQTQSWPRFSSLPLSMGELRSRVARGAGHRASTAGPRRYQPRTAPRGYGSPQDPCRDGTVAVPWEVPHSERIVCDAVPEGREFSVNSP